MDTTSAGHVIRVDPRNPDRAVIERAAKVIRRGGLVAFPTETVYGLGANALDATAVQRIFDAKRRALNDPVIVHLESVAYVETVARDVPEVVRVLADRFWPGPLTVVLPKRDAVPPNVTAGLPTVAVRVPRHAIALELIRAAGVPIAAPSANLFTRTSATTAAHVLEDLGNRVDLILDGGPADVGIESTVIAVEDGRLRLLRPGAVSVEDLLEELALHQITVTLVFGPRGTGRTGRGDDVAGDAVSSAAEEGLPAPSPGLMAKHYSPRARLLVFTGATDTALAALCDAAQEELSRGRRVGLLLCHEDAARLGALVPSVEIEDLGPCDDLATIARRLFAGMRRLDAGGVDTICARGVAPEGLGLAIMDRLTRAAGSVIEPGSAPSV